MLHRSSYRGHCRARREPFTEAALRQQRVKARARADERTNHEHGSTRRDLLLSSLAVLSTAAVLPEGPLLPLSAAADGEAAAYRTLADPILAYSFTYPSATSSGAPLSMVPSRAPEKYSSAAPLSADARQRIVAELVDLKRFVTVSVTVGPASGVLKGRAPEEWRAREVANAVLSDRSTARLSSGQRTALNDVQEAGREERGGQPYWLYEHVSQGSPNLANPNARETYRHALAVTAARPGLSGAPYLYTLNLACSEDMWSDLEGPFRTAVASFRLDEPGRSYIPPDKDPWLFF